LVGKLYAVEQVATALAKRLRMREWRVANATSKEELVHHMDNLENCFHAVREILKESILP
jgi:hypothetical protein